MNIKGLWNMSNFYLFENFFLRLLKGKIEPTFLPMTFEHLLVKLDMT